MQNDQIQDRLKHAISHKVSLKKDWADKHQKNREHHLKFRASIEASMKRRRANPRHQASARIMSRLRWLMRNREFQQGRFPQASTRKPTLSITEILGTDCVTFRETFGALFRKGMRWSNYGYVWQIGHRVPVRMFDCTDTNQLKACFHYLNLQPEFSDENSHRLNEE